MSKTPTAEEVLGLYKKKRLAEQQAWRANADDAVRCMREEVRTYEEFVEALAAYEQAQGPVTRDWLQERFGATNIGLNGRMRLIHDSQRQEVVLGVMIDEGAWSFRPIHNPTRERIEALVEMLGGEK